jgi:N-carbamoylputrescine amidase
MVTKLAVLQAALGGSRAENQARIVELIREAAAGGADIIQAPELFEGPYFPKIKSDEFFAEARPFAGNEMVAAMQALAAELEVVLPLSFFERDGNAYYNSLAVVDADGALMGLYRKSHIPCGLGYEEKHYFAPGQTGFKVWATKRGRLGVGICWDQWFPESSRAMALAGAEILLYPTAIGSEPDTPQLDTRGPWRRVMVGQAVANSVALGAANRVGDEQGQVFYGNSFLCDHQGELVASMDATEEGVAMADFDLDELARYRKDFGLLRDRRPELYGILTDPAKFAD